MSVPSVPESRELLFVGGRLFVPGGASQGRAAAIAARAGRIVAVGPDSELAARFARAERIELAGRLVTPGLIDCHTHLVYCGERCGEMAQRLAGVSYESIARAGGGIARTAALTGAASEAQLMQSALPRLDALLAEGVTTVEIKSGYGLTLDAERRMLAAARALAAHRAVEVRTTYLAAHVVPAGFAGGADGYTQRLCEEYLPAIAASGLADAVDAYCERIAFSVAQVERVFGCARELALPVKLHADQLSNMHGAALAARFGALSADHLEYTDEAGVQALARAGCVAVLLPGAYYFLRERRPPPVAALRSAGVPIAVATDCNPGTSPLASPLTAMNLAAVQFGLTVDECLAGVTAVAARALGLKDRGSLEAGQWCDLAVWEVDSAAELVFSLGLRPLNLRVWHGEPIPSRS